MYTFHNDRIYKDLNTLYEHAAAAVLEQLFCDENSENHWEVATYFPEQRLF
jgi:hypothetical protein